MLVLSRKEGEKILIGDDIELEIVRISGNRITLGITAPNSVKILRSELLSDSANNSDIGGRVDQVSQRCESRTA